MRALLPTVGAVALIIVLGSPAGVTDATTPSDALRPSSANRPSGATNTESSARPPQTQTHFVSPTALCESRTRVQTLGEPHEFYFSRVAYSGFGGFGYGGGRSWQTDYPKADQIFLSFIDRLLSNLDAYDWECPVLLDDPELRRFPFLYALEVGRMRLRPPEVEGLRNYLLQGGFLVIDDFWGTQEWENWEYEIRQVLPEYEIVDLPLDHNIFSTFYEIDEILQVPNVGNGVRGGPTYERDGFVPIVRGIHDDQGRLMVIINWNTDLGDAWEWADDPQYPLDYSLYAYEMGVNFIVYAMSH